MMKLVQGIEGVPTLVDFWIVEVVPGVVDTTQCYREEKWWPNMKLTRTHVRIVMEPCTRPLTMFRTKRSCFMYMQYFMEYIMSDSEWEHLYLGASIVQQITVEERRVLHRDCSINNTMIKDTEGGARGFFLDWEFAVQINNRNEYEIGGTVS